MSDCQNHTIQLIKYVTLTDLNGHVTGYTGTFALCLQCQILLGKLKKTAEIVERKEPTKIEGEVDLSSLALRTRFFDLKKIVNIIGRQEPSE